MIEGVMRHGTSMNVEGNYVDSHGQSEIGFAITILLGFKLLARIKQINRVKLYGPDPGSKEHYPRRAGVSRSTGAMRRSWRWSASSSARRGELAKMKRVVEIQGNVSALLEEMLGTESAHRTTER